jgi:hypothetical protein
MQLKEMINTIYAVLRKEERGGVFTPDDFNRYVGMFARQEYDYQKEQMERTETITTAMERYVRKVIRTPHGSLSYNYNTKPSSFEKHLSALALYNGTYSRKIDLVTEMEFEGRVGDALTQPTSRNPVIYYVGGYEYVFPNVGYTLTYMVSPAVPFLDYYYDSNRRIQYLDFEQSHTLGVGEIYRDGTDSGNVTSDTIELDMDEGMQINVMNRILRVLGVSVPNEGVFHYGSQETIKSER